MITDLPKDVHPLYSPYADGTSPHLVPLGRAPPERKPKGYFTGLLGPSVTRPYQELPHYAHCNTQPHPRPGAGQIEGAGPARRADFPESRTLLPKTGGVPQDEGVGGQGRANRQGPQLRVAPRPLVLCKELFVLGVRSNERHVPLFPQNWVP